MAWRKSSGQSTIGGRTLVAGKPSRTAATGVSRRRSTIALVKCVVPIITVAMESGETPASAKTAWRAAVIPEVTSGVVGVLCQARTFVPSIKTASVLVPPTSIPIRMGDLLCAIDWAARRGAPGSAIVYGCEDGIERVRLGQAPRGSTAEATRPIDETYEVPM